MRATEAPVKVALADGINDTVRRAVEELHFPEFLSPILLQHLLPLPEMSAVKSVYTSGFCPGLTGDTVLHDNALKELFYWGEMTLVLQLNPILKQWPISGQSVTGSR